MTTILSADYIDFTSIDNHEERIAPETHRFSVVAETFWKTIPLYAFRSMADAERALDHLQSACPKTCLMIYETL